MQHVIFGAGLVGGFLAGAMINNGLNVGVVARRSVQDKLGDGLRLTDYQGHGADVDVIPFIDDDALRDAPASQACDFLWLAVKCTAVERSVNDMAALVGPRTTIFCLQNGLGSEKSVKSRFPDNRVLRAIVMCNVAEPAAGHLHRGSEGGLSIEELTHCPEVSRDLAQQISCPLIRAQSCDHMQGLLWAKLQLNLANAVNAIADVPVKQMTEDRSYRLVIALLMRELLAVCKAKNIELPAITALPGRLIPWFLSLPDFVFHRLGQKMLAIDPTVRTSMWWDLSRGRATEIDYLNAAVVAESKTIGLPSPANSKMSEMVHQVERGERPQGMSGSELMQALTRG